MTAPITQDELDRWKALYGPGRVLFVPDASKFRDVGDLLTALPRLVAEVERLKGECEDFKLLWCKAVDNWKASKSAAEAAMKEKGG